MTTSNLKRPRSLRIAPTAATPFARTTLALGASTALLMPAMSSAQEVVEVKPVSITVRAPDHNPHGEPGAAYKAKTSGDERRVKPLAETPATITVLTQQQLLDTGRTDLREILRTQPGITLGTGENGNAFGDRYIIRGQEARSDVFVDGLRDPGMTVRESFATEQIEITKGPSATFAGRGATGGAVNSVTKQATTVADFTKLSVGLGSDDHRRLTLDANHAFSDDTALRVNLLESYEDVPDRSPAFRSRNGVALSLTHHFTPKLTVTTDYYHLKTKDRPDLGTWYENRKPVKKIPVYAQSEDFLESDIDTFTVRAAYRVDDTTRLSNLTRYGETQNGYVVTSASGGTNLVTPVSVAALSRHNGWQEVEYFANQTNLELERVLGGMKHTMLFSLELSNHKVTNGGFNIATTTATNCQTYGRNNAISNAYCFANAAGVPVADLNNFLKSTITRGAVKSDWSTKTVSASVMDTVDVTEQLSLSGGLRLDRFDYSNSNGGLQYKLMDNLVNAQVGAVYKFLPYANVYANISTGSDFNGGESDVTSCGYGGLCLVGTGDAAVSTFTKSAPEKSTNVELGSKWELMDGKLLATGALFQVTKRDVMEANTGNNYALNGTLNTGAYKVEGIELGLAGNITTKLSAHAGLAIMDSEITKTVTASNKGKELANLPKKTASVLMSYKFTPKFTFGGTVTYQSSKFSGSPESVAGTYKVPAYSTLDLFASYKFTRQLSARVNVNNVFNKTYYLATYTSGKFTYMGDARNVRATLNYDF